MKLVQRLSRHSLKVVTRIMVCGAGITVDIGDDPNRYQRCGGEIVQFGMPVEPGNMPFSRNSARRYYISRGCSRSKLNGLDWVLQRILAGIEVKPEHIMAMGVSGLIKDVAHSERRHRRAVQPKHQSKPRIAAIILAAGSSGAWANKINCCLRSKCADGSQCC